MQTPDFVIDGFLTQAKLEAAIQVLVPGEWLGRELQVPGSRHRWDMAFRTPSGVTVVEYDGDEHYRHSLKVKADRAKDETARDLGFAIVRVPYWVQLDTATLLHFFGVQAAIQQSFPHGFITTRLFPASFCELGIARFSSELNGLPPPVRAAIEVSLQDRIREHGLEYVLPHALRHLARA